MLAGQQTERADACSASHCAHHVPDAHRREHPHPAEGQIRRQDAAHAERVLIFHWLWVGLRGKRRPSGLQNG